MIEVDGLSLENTLPLRGGDAGWGVQSDFNEELGFGDVEVVGSQESASLLATGVTITGGGRHA